MPFDTDLNINPYFDDFDEQKNFHKVIFRPAVPVQARELNTLQSILQNQIERFGSWAFKNGDIVEGCAISDMPKVPFVYLADTDANGDGYDARNYVNCFVVSATSNLQARVIAANVGFSANYPNSNILYMSYINTGNNGATVFTNNELLKVYSVSNGVYTLLANNANVYSLANSTGGTVTVGNAHGISVSEGIIFINGAFVRVENATFGLVNAYGQDAANNVVGFRADETIITENQDSTLYDNALGYPNENAPGAHRLKVLPTLISLDAVTAANTAGFTPIATYNYGTLVHKKSANDVNATVADALANRTYEESGDYVVSPFLVDSVTTTLDANVAAPNSSTVYATVHPGVGYVKGYRVDIEKTTYVTMRRGTDTRVNESQQITFNYGGYFSLNECAGSFAFDKGQSVYLYNTAQRAVTNKTYASVSPTGTLIGNAQVRCFTYQGGTSGTNTAIYYLHVYNIQLANGYGLRDVQSVYANTPLYGVGDLATPGLQNPTKKAQLFSFGISAIKNLRDGANNNNSEYTYRYTANATMYSNGQIVCWTPSSQPGGTDVLPWGTGQLADTEALTIQISPAANGSSTPAIYPGTVQIFSDSGNVVGSSTTFTNNFVVGDNIKVASEPDKTVISIVNNTFMVVDSVHSTNASGQSYVKDYLKGKFLSFSTTANGNYGTVTVTNTTSFTVQTSERPSSSLPVHVTFNVLRTGVYPSTKKINKNRFVKLDVRSNPMGPWCLGFSDVHKVAKVYGAATNTYSTSGVDLTSQFTWTTGQKDTHYDLAYLYPKNTVSFEDTPYLLVQLDYFQTNTAPGVGFFTVESYPIDDTDAANNYAIQTKDIPLYVDDSGNKIALRDVIDFRPVATPTANNTGDVLDLANTTLVTTAIGYASYIQVNNATFSTLSFPTSYSYNVPAYSKNFQADFTNYLPRKDLVYITPDNTLKIKEGVPSMAPQTPLSPDAAMVLAAVSVPPFPTLSSDQILDMVPINQSCVTLCRDTRQKLGAVMMSNRRYTMRDIGKLDKRISSLEYYAQLSMLEKDASSMTVTDGNGLDRFKNGIFVDGMQDASLCETSSPELTIAFDRDKGRARPPVYREVVYMKLDSGTNYQQTGRAITLPYTHIEWIKQPFATKYRAASHAAYAWNGHLTLFPSYTNHQDVTQMFNNVTLDQSGAWEDYANNPINTKYGDWRTTVNTEITKTYSGEVKTYNLNIWVGYIGPGIPLVPLTQNQLYSLLTRYGIQPSQNYVIGRFSYWDVGTWAAGPWATYPPAGFMDATYEYGNVAATLAARQAGWNMLAMMFMMMF